jgi:hypothetical protein
MQVVAAECCRNTGWQQMSVSSEVLLMVAVQYIYVVSACDTRKEKRQGATSIYCQCDEHDAGYNWSPPHHPFTFKRSADSPLFGHADVQSAPVGQAAHSSLDSVPPSMLNLQLIPAADICRAPKLVDVR